MNALTLLVSQSLSKNNLSRKQLAQKLGYSNISKGLRSLDQYCLTLLDKNEISSTLPKALNIPAYKFENAVFDVSSKLELKARSLFSPSIQITPSSRPTPIFAVAMFPSLMNIQVPDMSACSFGQELQIVFDAYKSHQLEHCSNIYSGNNYEIFIEIVEQMDKENKPYAWITGTGFRYFRTYEQTIEFNRYGEIVDHINFHAEPNMASISVGGKTILPSILGHLS